MTNEDYHLIYTHVFILFLTHHNALNDWMDNVLDKHDTGSIGLGLFGENLKHRDVNDIVDFSFTWSHTPQGGGYWTDLSVEWYYICNEMDKMIMEGEI